MSQPREVADHRSGRRRTWAALVFLLALTIGLCWPLTVSHDYTWLENPDQALQVRPWLDYEAREIHAGRLPLWDPYLWGGQSLIGQVQPGVVNPINWILFALPLRDGHIPTSTLHWYWVTIHWLAAVFAFRLCRDLQCGHIASLLGGVVFAFMGFMGHATTPQFLMSALWLPVILLFFARVFRGQRAWSSAAFCGATLGLSFLSGHHNIPIYTAVLLGSLWFWLVFRGTGFRLPVRLGQAAVFAAVCFLVSAVQSLPAIEYGRQAVRWSGVPEPQHWGDKLPYSVHAEYSLYAKSIPGMAIPGLGVHAEPFVGIVALGMAFTALVQRRRSREVQLFAAVALGGLLLALGKDTPIHRLAYDFIPLVDKARYPAMAIAICQAGIAALAALGLEAWRSACSKIVLAVLVLFAATVTAAYFLHRYPIDRRALAVAAVAVVLAAVLYWGRAYPAAVLGLLLLEAMVYPVHLERFDRPNSYAATIAAQSDIAAFLHRQPGWFRVDADEDVVPYNFGDWFGIEQFGGYVASMPDRIYRVNGRQETAAQFGVRYRIARTPASPAQAVVFESRSGLKVFEDSRISEPLHVVRGSPCAGTDGLRVVSRTPNAFSIDADLACPGFVNVGDPWFQGWRAWLDGKRTAIQERETPIRTVACPGRSSSHRVPLPSRFGVPGRRAYRARTGAGRLSSVVGIAR